MVKMDLFLMDAKTKRYGLIDRELRPYFYDIIQSINEAPANQYAVIVHYRINEKQVQLIKSKLEYKGYEVDYIMSEGTYENKPCSEAYITIKW